MLEGMSSEAITALERAERCKEKGNACFKKDKFSAAIEAYTEAITLCPDVPVFWTNRAICHRKRNDWERVESDCRKALELDRSSVKAHYYLGLALLEVKQYEEAVKELEKALELGRGGKPTSYILEEIWQDLGTAKFRRWQQQADNKAAKHSELRAFCNKLIESEFARKVMSSEHTNVSGGDTYGTKCQETDDAEPLQEDAQDRDLQLARLQHELGDRLKTLSDVFDRSESLDKPGEVPDYLCCKITMDVFRDPVVCPSGVTYERASLLEHLQKVGRFDPLTRTSLHPDQIVPNFALKEAVQAYLDEHGWAYKM